MGTASHGPFYDQAQKPGHALGMNEPGALKNTIQLLANKPRIHNETPICSRLGKHSCLLFAQYFQPDVSAVVRAE
jgi:hypothetical protein